MTRRSCISGLAASLLTPLGSLAAPGLAPLDEEGFRRMVAGHRGKVLLVDFWATWCASCREELPKLVSLSANERRNGLDFVTISCDEPEQTTQAAAFLSSQQAPEPRYIRQAKDDDRFINAIDPKWSGALPALFVFDRGGNQVHSFIGETDTKQIEAVLNKLLAR